MSTALRDPSASVRKRAAWALCELNPDRPVEPIVTALRAGHGSTEEPASILPDARDMLDLGLEFCACNELNRSDEFVLLSRDTDPELRARAALVLATLSDPKSVRAVAELAEDEDPSVRRFARLALRSVAREQT